MPYPFRPRDPRLLRASLLCFAIAGLIGWTWYGCAGVPQRGFVLRKGSSNGPAYTRVTGYQQPFAYEYLRSGNTPVRNDPLRTAHPIISGNAAAGFITQGLANQRPDPFPLTEATYSGFVLAGPGLDWRGIR